MSSLYPARGLAFIRKISTEDHYPGSPILLTDKSREKISACQFVVVSVGDYEFCEDLEECPRKRHTKKGEHPHDLVEGDWILARHRSWDLTPDPDVYVVRQSDVIGKFTECTAAPSSARPTRPRTGGRRTGGAGVTPS